MLDRLDWTALSPGEAEKVLAVVLFEGDATPTEELDCFGHRADLPFYPTVDLVRVTLKLPGQDRIERIFVLAAGDGYYYLDGTSAPIHACNAAEGIEIDEATAPDYLRFFCFAVRGNAGPFRIFEEVAEIADADEDLASIASALEDLAEPVEALGRDDGGKLRYKALVEYGGGLFQSEFSISDEGHVLMEDDEPLMADLPSEPFVPLPTLRPATAVASLVWTSLSRRSPGENTFTVLVRLLLEEALATESGSRLLSHFNAKLSRGSELEGFAHMVGTASPVVAVESSLPFVEETIGRIIREQLTTPALRGFRATPSMNDDTKLTVDVPEDGPALGLIPYHAYRGLANAEWVAHALAARDVSCLIGCERLDDLPPSLREVLDLTLELPRLDDGLFEALFRRMMGDDPPDGWNDDGSHWVSHVHHSDFQQPVGLGLSPGEAVEFIQERAEGRLRDVEPVKGLGLSDLHGLGEARVFAEDLITDIHEAIDGRLDWMHVDRGVLLVGEPGTGKTTLARAIARDCGIRFVNASAASWQAVGHLGDHIRALRADFSRARRFAPSILFIDEIDSIGNRQQFAGKNTQYLTEVVNAVLEQIQGMDPEAPVIVIGATNFEENVDPALKRAGRLDRVIRIPRPNVKALGKIYEHYLEEYVGDDREGDVDPETLGGLSLGRTGADVELYVRGALRRARRERRDVRQADLVAEITRKPRDPDSVRRLTPDEVHRVAVHEAGHALASCLDGSDGEGLSFVSVVPRSDGTLGFVARLPTERVFYTRAEYLGRLEVFLAGRAAEEIVFGRDQVTSGAGGPSTTSDLAVATRAALQIVSQHGLGPEGSLLWTDRPDDGQRREADQLLREAYERVREKLEARRETLDAITAELVDRQEMTGDEVRGVVGEA